MIVALVGDYYSPAPLKPPATQTKLHHSVSFKTMLNCEVASPQRLAFARDACWPQLCFLWPSIGFCSISHHYITIYIHTGAVCTIYVDVYDLNAF